MYTGPNIVRNGLVLNLDAANVKSYSSGSTVWNDLSRNYNATITGVSTYTSNYGGGIYVSGSGIGSIDLPASIISSNNNYTIEVCANSGSICKGETTINWAIVDFFSPGGNLNVVYTSPLAQYTTTPQKSNVDQVSITTIVINQGVGLYEYTNGNLAGSLSTTAINIRSNSDLLRFSGGIYNKPGTYYYIRIYNRALSASEIQQNYEAQKSRYNL